MTKPAPLAQPFPYKPRQIVKVDLSPVLHQNEETWTNVVRMCVVLEADPTRVRLIFAAWEAYHHKTKCACIQPGDAWATPFGAWLIKSTHFSPHNVVDVPASTPCVELVNEVPYAYPPEDDLFEVLTEVASYAELQRYLMTMN